MSRGLRRELSGLFALAAAGCLGARRRNAAALLAGGALALRFWPGGRPSFSGKAVVITGGSRGLGLALAEAFLREGAKVALLARDDAELRRAQSLLLSRTGRGAITVPCDVTQRAAMATVLPRIQRAFGRVDLLINNAGAMVVGPFEKTPRDDFERLMEIHVYAVVSATQAVLPVFRRQGGGQIVNICSIGGKFPHPHLSAYCAAKFALAGLSQVMAAELAQRNIDVTTVYPGLMRTGSAIQAETRGDQDHEFAWFALSAVMPGISMAPDRAAAAILDGVARREPEVVFPSSAKLAIFAQTHYPQLLAFVLRRAARLFPAVRAAMKSGSGAQATADLEKRFWFKPIRALAARAERRWNQRPAGPAALVSATASPSEAGG